MKNKKDIYSCTSFIIYHKIEISKGKIFWKTLDENPLTLAMRKIHLEIAFSCG